MISWVTIAFTTVVYTASLQSVPAELYEVARVDGACAWQRFRAVTLPMIAPGVTTSITLSLISTLKLYDVVAVLTDGGLASSTKMIAFYLLDAAFINNRFGYSSAIATFLLIAYYSHRLRNFRFFAPAGSQTMTAAEDQHQILDHPLALPTPFIFDNIQNTLTRPDRLIQTELLNSAVVIFFGLMVPPQVVLQPIIGLLREISLANSYLRFAALEYRRRLHVICDIRLCWISTHPAPKHY